MPNWVYNTMNVTGSPDDVKTFILEMATPIPTFVYPEGSYVSKDGEWKTEDTVFSFWNAIAPTNLEHYFTSDHWYHWNNSNWGTKWDAKVDEKSTDDLDFSVYADGTGAVTYRFDTAWGTPTPVFIALTKKYPHLEFDIEYEEEQGWGGSYSGSGGELIHTGEYDIPDSHADYAERGREDSCDCTWADSPEDMYEDCPARIEFDNGEDTLIAVDDLTTLTNTVTV